MEKITAQRAYNALAEVYDKSFTSNTAKAEDDVVYSFLNSFLINGSVLDLGCGTGALLEHLNVPPESYIGVDVSEKMLEKARCKFPGYTFHLGDMANLPFTNEQFDNVVSLFGSISYADPKVCCEIRHLLKWHGKYFLMFCNERYGKRKAYILNRHSFKVHLYSFNDAKPFLPTEYIAEGFNFHGDTFNFMPKHVIKWILQIERRLLGKLFKTHAFFCLVYGENR